MLVPNPRARQGFIELLSACPAPLPDNTRQLGFRNRPNGRIIGKAENSEKAMTAEDGGWKEAKQGGGKMV